MLPDDDGMIAVAGVRYRYEDALSLGLVSLTHNGRHAADDDGGSQNTGADVDEGEEPETAAAPDPDNKDATPSGGGNRRRPTAKE